MEQGGRPLQKENAAASDNTPSEPCGAATQELAQPKSDQGANRGRSSLNPAGASGYLRATPRGRLSMSIYGETSEGLAPEVSGGGGGGASGPGLGEKLSGASKAATQRCARG